MKKFVAIALLIVFGMSSCGDNNQEKVGVDSVTKEPSYDIIAKYEWLAGTWQNTSTEGVATEKWEIASDSVYMGRSYFVVGNDTVSSEKLSLEQKGRELFYVPTVKDQNNNKAVYFKMTSSTESQVIFENPEHDFPQKITYSRVAADSMVAEISGVVEGKPQMQQFPMRRIN